MTTCCPSSGAQAQVNEVSVGAGLFYQVKVLALEILQQRPLGHGAVVGLDDPDRDLGEAAHAAGPESALAGDDHVAAAARGNDDGLEQAVFPDALRQLLQLARGDLPAGLVRVGEDSLDRHDGHCDTSEENCAASRDPALRAILEMLTYPRICCAFQNAGRLG